MGDKTALAKYVHIVATSKSDSLDPVAFKAIKDICRRDESASEYVVNAILKQLAKANAAIRLNSWRLAEQLFDRSHAFRQHLLEQLEDVALLVIGVDPARPLPPPRETAARLQSQVPVLCYSLDWIWQQISYPEYFWTVNVLM